MSQPFYRLSRSITASIASVAFVAAACYSTSIMAQGQPLPSGNMNASNKCGANRHPDEALVGKSEAELSKLLEGCPWRVTERDGQPLPATRDYNKERRNVGIKDGVAVWIKRG